MKEEPLTNDELQLFNRRDFLIKSVISIPFAGILWRLWDLQINNGEKYNELSKGNRIRLKSVPAPRGIIYDGEGELLSKNIPSYNLALVREDTKNIEEVLQKLSRTLQIPLKSMQRAMEEKKGTAKFQAIQIYKGLTHYQIAVVSSYLEEFPGISIEVSPQRYYPKLQIAAHILGYMALINKKQLQKLPRNKIKSAEKVGQEGIERVYNNKLIGTDGGIQVEVDSTGRIIRTMNSIDPIPGHDIQLNLVSRLQKSIGKIFKNQKGAAVVMDPHTGAVKAMVTLPSYDPNEFSRGISSKRWKELINDPNHILNNKCIQGIFSPGSTFKMAVAAAALEEGIIDEHTEILCEGRLRYKRHTYHCWKRSGHGSLNVVEAIENSCNVFFYRLAVELGIEKISNYARQMGLGKITQVDLMNEKTGVVPDRAWKKKRFGEMWYGGETISVAIGQGYMSVTPLQLVNYINIFANDGYLVTPRIVETLVSQNTPEIEEEEVEEVKQKRERSKIIRKKVYISDSTLQIIRKGMEQNVSGENGTGKRGKSDLVSIAGKTGTTQVVSLETRNRIIRDKGEVDKKFLDHAWFTGFAPANDPKISVAVLIENGQSGSRAAELAKKIFDYYFTEIAPLPPPPPPELETVDDEPSIDTTA